MTREVKRKSLGGLGSRRRHPRAVSRVWPILAAVGLVGCGEILGVHEFRAGDATSDAGASDSGADAGLPDSNADAGPPDSGEIPRVSDAGRDSSVPDAGSDAGPCGGLDSDDDGVADACDRCAGYDDRLDSDGDLVPDGCDVCGDGDDRIDTDGDLVRDACDACPGSDDALDGDADGIPDACDDWPCGLRPSVPLGTAHEGISVSGFAATSGGRNIIGNTAVVSPSEVFQFAFSWQIAEGTCPGCVEQIEVGLAPGFAPFACAFDAVVPVGGAGGSSAMWAFSPTFPGVYGLRFRRGQRGSCLDGGSVWFGGEPPEAQSFAAICVAP